MDLINVIGMGYIGLPTALMLASKGKKVVGSDYDENKIHKLILGEITFEEEGLAELFEEAVSNNITFSSEYQTADIYIIAVPTPFDKKKKTVVADYLVDAVNNVIKKAKSDSVIVVESTISPGTIDKYVAPVVDKWNDENKTRISIAHAPERIIPGNMIRELTQNNRTIGADSKDVAERIRNVYKTFCQGEIAVTDIRTAEMSKVVENSFRDINIAFANELVKICKEARVDVYELIRIANLHPRVNILTPGPGVGGHCISVDPWFLVGDYPGLANIILAARKINDSMPEYVLERISEVMEKEKISSISKVGLYGLTYKENVDDIRESPTLQLLENMKKHLANGIKVYDPYIKQNIVENQYHNLDEFLQDIDLLVIMVGHDEIIDKQELLQNKVVMDTRNVLKKIKSYKL